MPRKPSHLVPPCGPGFENRVTWLSGLCSHRGGYDYSYRCQNTNYYSRGPWLFCWSVKLYGIDLDFDNLLQKFVSCGNSAPGPKFIEKARQLHQDLNREELLNMGIEDASRTFTGRDGDTPDDDAFNMLWDGSPVDTRFSFMGRGGGWLVMTSFQGLVLDESFDLKTISYKTLRGLSEMVYFVDRTIRGKACDLVEDQVAFNFFVNVCYSIKEE